LAARKEIAVGEITITAPGHFTHFRKFQKMKFSSFLRRLNVEMLLVAGLFVLTLVVGSVTPNPQYDDAFITYRYARNLSTGQGFVYNPGEHVLGTTTPLYTLALSGLGRVWPDYPLLSRTLGILFWAGAVVMTYLVTRRYAGRAAGVLAAVLLATHSWIAAAIGMESTLYIFLLMASLTAYLFDRSLLASALLALLVLTRPDGLLMVGLVFIHFVWRRRRLPWREALVFGVVLLPWLVYSLATFGSPLPNSASAKFGQSGRMSLDGKSSNYLDGLSLYFGHLTGISGWYWLTVPLLAAGAWAVRRTPLAFFAAAWLAGYIAAYVLLGVVYFPWYYVPLLPLACALIGSGAMLVGNMAGKLVTSSQQRVVVSAVVAVILVAPAVNVQAAELDRIRSDPGYHDQTYMKVAAWLTENASPEDTVALLEIGVVGYYSGQPVIDTMGLVTPRMTTKQTGWVETLRVAVSQFWPAYAVALNGTGWNAIRHEAWFTDRYEPVAEIANPPDGISPITIYRYRPDAPRPTIDTPVDVSFGDLARLNRVRLSERSLQRGESLYVEIDWEALRSMTASYRVIVTLINPDTGRAIAQSDSTPVYGSAPTTTWRRGERLNDEHRLLIPADAPFGRYEVWVSMRPAGGGDSVLVSGGPSDSSADVVKAAAVKIVDPARQIVPPQVSLSAQFDDLIALLGHNRWPDAIKAGAAVEVDLQWRALANITDDLTVFIHVVDSEGKLVAQSDGQPQNGAYPTSIWDKGEIVQDRHILALPPDLAPGDYRVKIGLYLQPTGVRLPARSADGVPLADDGVELTPLRVQ
jgi:hypothetical protein